MLKGTWQEIREGLEVKSLSEGTAPRRSCFAALPIAPKRNRRCASGLRSELRKGFRRLCEDASGNVRPGSDRASDRAVDGKELASGPGVFGRRYAGRIGGERVTGREDLA